eukprot:CAMPEP_0198295380 /NCGR_PEP_ID=MMETSP1449-20131203/27356_1 /TAXON_ID=420275 /ORGANISM="Attheya septentrionalis, Strain CCMP2084" /LENGTH=408 /DNA_ID=CAMNT_0043995665 /DNA_START=82 /DNA_END=1308 /DNA_ORIENTATION=-
MGRNKNKGDSKTSTQSPKRQKKSLDYNDDRDAALFFHANKDDFGGENMSGEDTDEEPLSWRLDGADSLSDWTITIKRASDPSGASETYHVHKNILAVGPRKSDYFASLFKVPAKLSESNTSTSIIELDDSAASAFPYMLDYMYSANGEADFSTERATALRYLAEYFNIRRLLIAATNFIRRDIRAATAPMYLAEASAYSFENIAAATGSHCAEHLEDIDRSLIARLSPALLQKIVYSPKIKCGSLTLSLIVSHFFEDRPEDHDDFFFTILTDNKLIPTIHPRAATPLLKLYLHFRECEKGTVGINHDSLRQRCVYAIATSWKDELSKPPLEKENKIYTYRDLPESVRIEVLEASLLYAKEEIDEKDNMILSKNEEIEELGGADYIDVLDDETVCNDSVLLQLEEDCDW